MLCCLIAAMSTDLPAPVSVTISSNDGVQVIFAGIKRTGLKSIAEAMRQLGYHEIYDRVELCKTFASLDEAIHNKATPETRKSMFNGVQGCNGHTRIRVLGTNL